MRNVLNRCINDCSDEQAFGSAGGYFVVTDQHKKEEAGATEEVMDDHGKGMTVPSYAEEYTGLLAADSDEAPSWASPNDDDSPEHYWHGRVVPHFSQGQRDLLAERLFCHVWNKEGRDAALAVLDGNTSESLQRTATDRFDQGCRLWGEDQHNAALWELQRSRALHEARHEMGLLHVRHRPGGSGSGSGDAADEGRDEDGAAGEGREINTESPSETESHAQLYYALGTVQLALNEQPAALREYRRALQVSVLGLGEDHQLTQATLYMIRCTLLTLGLPSPKIQKYAQCLLGDLRRETEGDDLFAAGEWDQALLEYVSVGFLKDRDAEAQARIRAKMALVFEEKGDYMKALELWSTVMALYAGSCSIGLDHPLTRHATMKFVQNRSQVGSFEI